MHAGSVPDDFVSRLGSGRPMDEGERALFEPRFSRSLGDLRIHTDTEASHAAGLIQAKAFTSGHDIAFGANQYDPHTDTGRRLLAHELTHVLQQDGESAGPPIQRNVLPPPEQERERRATEQRHRQWERSHREQHGGLLAAQPRTLAQDVESTRALVIEQRMALLREASERAPAPGLAALGGLPSGSFQFGFLSVSLPPELADKWARAQSEVVIVEALLKEGVFTPEEGATASAAFVEFYQALLPVAEAADGRDQERQRMSELLAQPSPAPVSCPGSCHAPNPAPRPPVFQAPPSRAPGVRDALGLADRAATEDEWRDVLRRFGSATRVMDSITLSTLPVDSPARQGFSYATGLLERQEELQRNFPNAIKIPAIFYPKDKLVTTEDGEQREIATGIPWYFYLTYTPPRDDPYNYPAGFEWTLRDVTSPKRPEVHYQLSAPEAYTRSVGRVPPYDPPPPLFRRLNDKLVFPEGMLYWTSPNGKAGALETTEPWSLSDWLSAIGMGLAALAIVLGTAGMATPAVLAGLGILGAAAGIGSTLADLQARSELGILTQEDKEKAVLFIAADLASALTLGLGRSAAGAARAATTAGRATRLTFVVQRAARAANVADRVLGAAVVVTVSADFVEQYRTIQQSNLPDADREAALRRLALTGLLTGAMMVVPHVAGRGPHGPEVHTPGDTPHGEAGGPHPSPSGSTDVITVTRGAGEPEAGWSRPRQDAEFLAWSKQQERLPPAKAAQELQIAQEEAVKRPIANDPVYSHELEINGHTWRQRRDGRAWCRFTTKVCYPSTQLRVGAAGDADRVSTMATVADVARFRSQELARPPSSVTTDQARLDWADYRFYADRRLRMIEDALAAGRTAPAPPRTLRSFQENHPPGSVVRNEIQGARFEARTRQVFEGEVAPERRALVLSQPHLSESTTPTRGRGELTRADFLFPSSQVPGYTAVSNKSRSSFVDASAAETKTRVIRDLEEAVEKYAGERQLRRSGAPTNVTRIWLMYDAAMVPRPLRAGIRQTVREFQHQYRHTGLVLEVGIF
jgi:hypothetical protein